MAAGAAERDARLFSPARAGRLAALLLLPNLGLGLYLFVVPDQVAFVAAQVATLTHVVLALLTVPIAVVLATQHARRSVTPQSAPRLARASTWFLTAAATGALGTGLGALVAYPRLATALHALFGVGVVVPLTAHLLLVRRRATGAVVAAVSAMSLAGASSARQFVRGDTREPRTPPFAYSLEPASRYDGAEWCGHCHHDAFSEWSRSTHAHTFDRRRFLASLQENPGTLEHHLAEEGEVLYGRRPIDTTRDLRTAAACTTCHAPLAFYSDAGDPRDHSQSSEGVGCSFCHTLRAVERDGHMGAAVREVRGRMGGTDARRVIEDMPYYVSAPDTVRRYLFQHSGNRWTEWVGDMLIRWRPTMHRSDYKTAFLSTNLSCRGCHPDAMDTTEVADLTRRQLLSAPPGQQSTFTDSGAAAKPCLGCHMAPAVDFRSASSASPRRSHLFLGGNVEASLESGASRVARLEHLFAANSVAIEVSRTSMQGRDLSIEVKVRNDQTTHAFPAFEAGGARIAWVRVSAFGPAGEVLADSQRGDDGPSEAMRVTVDSVMAPGEERSFHLSLRLPGDTPPTKVLAELFKSLDGTPVAAAMRTLAGGR